MPARRHLLAAAAALAVPASAQQPAVLRGTATYRERIALPPGTVLELVLEDTARADAPAVRIAGLGIPVQGQVPIEFALPYDPARLDPRARPVLRAILSHEGRVLFRTATAHPVPDAAAPVTLLLVRAGGPAEAGGGIPAALVGPRWVVQGLDHGVEAYLTFTAEGAPPGSAPGAAGGAVFGSGGCNRLRGSYRASGPDGLGFGPIATTMMACEPPADAAERRVLDALAAVRHWRIADGVLELRDAAGATLLRLGRD